MSMNDDNRLFKVLVVGASGAGKSCLLLQFADGIFIDSHVSTIGVDFKLADVQRPHPVTRQPMPCKLQIWDTAGQERFRTITNSFYRGAQATIVVFDVSDEQSLHAVPAFVADAKRFSPGGEATRIYLVANKCDRAEVVPREVAHEMAASLGCVGGKCVFVSARTGDGLAPLFNRVADDLLESAQRRLYDMASLADKAKLRGEPVLATSRKARDCGTCAIL